MVLQVIIPYPDTINMECLHSRPFLCPQCEEAQLLIEAVLSGCKLAVTSPREAGA